MAATETFVDLLTEEGASLVVQYGSSVSGADTPNDIDLLALYGDEADRGHVDIGPFDVMRLSETAFRGHRRVLNPVYCTEPVLNGELRHGDAAQFRAIEDDVREATPDERVIAHNVRRGAAELEKAFGLFDADRDVDTVRTLTFVHSYFLFAEWYAEGHEPTCYATVRERVSTPFPVARTRTLHADRKTGDDPESEVIDRLLTETAAAVVDSSGTGFEN